MKATREVARRVLFILMMVATFVVIGAPGGGGHGAGGGFGGGSVGGYRGGHSGPGLGGVHPIVTLLGILAIIAISIFFIWLS